MIMRTMLAIGDVRFCWHDEASAIRRSMLVGIAFASTPSVALPAAQIYQAVYTDAAADGTHSGSSSDFGAVHVSSAPGLPEVFAHSSVDGAHGGGLAATVVAQDAYASAQATLDYTLRVRNYYHSRPEYVSVHITAQGRAGVSIDPEDFDYDDDLAFASANFNINYGLVGEDGNAYSYADKLGGGFVDDFSIDENVTLVTNRDYRVELSANAHVGSADDEDVIRPVHGYAFAYVDPVFAINDRFGGYRLYLSPGITNGVVAVPEPAGWTLLVTGFGAVGAALRRRGRHTEAVAA